MDAVRATSGRSVYNFYRDYNPATGRYVESDPLGLYAGNNTYAYVYGNPIYWVDVDGLAPKPGRNGATPVPGTNYSTRIDPPHVPGQQEHAHIYDGKGNSLGAINKDGTGSHGTCPGDLPKNKKLWGHLGDNGFTNPGANADAAAARAEAAAAAAQAEAAAAARAAQAAEGALLGELGVGTDE